MGTLKLCLLSILCSVSINAQDIKIDSTNYCDFYDYKAHYKNSDVKSFGLTRTMIIDIVTNEMEKLGFKWISTFRIIKIEEGKYVTSICYSDKSNCGFLFDEVYETEHNQEDRKWKSLTKKYSGNDYGDRIVSLDGSYKFVNIKEVPDNLHILKMNDYWYQQSSNPEKIKKLVSKEFIENLLREDVRRFLKNFKP
ncbi:hypothetical protein [Flavobacterium sp.]|uniref:hypothetical protein n=1 Tax=Flavobacterium sp. TaxID=239 RepID=UPI002639B79F|nr:hypothetical protein [Flavobacterium sp.]